VISSSFSPIVRPCSLMLNSDRPMSCRRRGVGFYAREDLDAAGVEVEGVLAVQVAAAAHLHDPQPQRRSTGSRGS
jgi:hypothetical protein